jgi:hypothetical protein
VRFETDFAPESQNGSGNQWIHPGSHPESKNYGWNPGMDILQAIEVELVRQPDSFAGDDHQIDEKNDHPIAGNQPINTRQTKWNYHPTAVRDLLLLKVIIRENTQPYIHYEGDN